MTKVIIALSILTLSISACSSEQAQTDISTEPILYHEVNPKEKTLRFYWRDAKNEAFVNYEKLKTHVEKEGEELVFAMNGGMFHEGYLPTGLYIENSVEKSPINLKKKAYGNFFMQPNGVFYLTKSNEAFVCETDSFQAGNVKYATQSGPLLLINGQINSKFKKGSKNLNIRNGVGVLENGHILFAMSKTEVNLYDFAEFFKEKSCKMALYLDGHISKTYLPSKNYKELEGTFGVMIAEVDK
ncbi:MAG: phosphodiester glycosidase family protein [Saprospiraceae bacterium]|nr:phosphodiester glycosidase family protein [Saprospiraceae bacterium]